VPRQESVFEARRVDMAAARQAACRGKAQVPPHGELPRERVYSVDMRDTFRSIADRTAVIIGSPWTFVGSVIVTGVWLVLGPVFQYSDTWQLTMNTLASQATFLVAFLLQNTQNRDTRALQLKLDELLRSTTGARNDLVQLENMSDDELGRLHEEFETLKRRRSAREPRGPA
jgi:low affinity Fe/Cu permease